MALVGTELGVELDALTRVSWSCEDMGAAHTEASSSVAGVEVKAAFTRQEELGTGATGSFETFNYFREKITGIIHRNGESLNDTAQALKWCVEAYAHSDTAARIELEKRQAAIPR